MVQITLSQSTVLKSDLWTPGSPAGGGGFMKSHLFSALLQMRNLRPREISELRQVDIASKQ